MKLVIGMPEVLVLFSALMYNQSWGLSVFALVLGIISRFVTWSMETTKEKEKEEKKLENAKSIEQAVSNILGVFSDKD